MIITDVLVLLGVAGATIAVAGVVRSRSGYMQIHASSLAMAGGVLIILGAAVTTGDGAIIGRSALVAGVLLLTTPVSSHALARLQFHVGGDAARTERPHHPEGDGGGSHTSGASPG